MSPTTDYPNGLKANHQLEEYQIVDVLGDGGFAITYKALDTGLNRYVAIKEFLPAAIAIRDGQGKVRPRSNKDKDEFEWGRKRFLDEARTLAQFHHPNIVSVIRFFEANNTAYIVMGYEEGKDMEHMLNSMPEAPSETAIVDKLLLPILDGLALVHSKGIWHRDIKPSNIFIRIDDTPVLIDFGSARQDFGNKSMTLTSVVSAGYSPLEQYSNASRQGPYTDLYAMAGTVYHAMTGKRPPNATDRVSQDTYIEVSKAAKRSYSSGLCKAIDAALRMKIEDRPQSVDEFLNILNTGKSKARNRGAKKHNRTITGPSLAKVLPKKALFGGLSAIAALLLVLLFLPQLSGPKKPSSLSNDELAVLYANSGKRSEQEQPESKKPEKTESDPPVEPREQETVQLSEDTVLEGLAMNAMSKQARRKNIDGTLLNYIASKNEFNKCLQNRCGELAEMKRRLESAASSKWSNGSFSGALTISHGQKTEIDGCEWRITVSETISASRRSVTQNRTYCTRNGINRSVDTQGQAM